MISDDNLYAISNAIGFGRKSVPDGNGGRCVTDIHDSPLKHLFGYLAAVIGQE